MANRPLFHLALSDDWDAARRLGRYEVSTRGRTLAQEGFIHLSREDQWPGVRRRFYADVEGALLLLTVDADRLHDPLVDEEPFPGANETFPHLYGPLPITAVTQVRRLDPPHGSNDR